MSEEKKLAHVRMVEFDRAELDLLSWRGGSEHPPKVLDITDAGGGLHLVKSLHRRESFSFSSSDPELGDLVFDVRGIKDAILSDQVLYKTFEADVTQELVDHVFTSNGVEEARLATINEQDLARPGVMILWRDMSSVLIDGNHRLVAGWRMGRTVFRYVGVPIGRELVPYVCRPGGEDKFFEREEAVAGGGSILLSRTIQR